MASKFKDKKNIFKGHHNKGVPNGHCWFVDRDVRVIPNVDGDMFILSTQVFRLYNDVMKENKDKEAISKYFL